jgi:hypothetical protein
LLKKIFPEQKRERGGDSLAGSIVALDKVQKYDITHRLLKNPE